MRFVKFRQLRNWKGLAVLGACLLGVVIIVVASVTSGAFAGGGGNPEGRPGDPNWSRPGNGTGVSSHLAVNRRNTSIELGQKDRIGIHISNLDAVTSVSVDQENIINVSFEGKDIVIHGIGAGNVTLVISANVSMGSGVATIFVSVFDPNCPWSINLD